MWLVDVSSHGARFHGARVPRVGTRMRIALSAASHLLRLSGAVVWCQSTGMVAVDFDRTTPAQHVTLATTFLTIEASNEPGAVLLMLDQPATRAAMGNTIRGLGYRVIALSTPLAVIQTLVEPGLALRAAIVSADLPNRAGQNVLAFLADECPEVLRALVVGPAHVAVRSDRDRAPDRLVSRVDEIPALLAGLERRQAS